MRDRNKNTKRKFQRAKVKIPLLYRRYADKNFKSAQIEDISEGGLKANFPESINSGESILLKFALPVQEEPLIVLGQVRWFKENSLQAGIEFVGIKKEDQEIIFKYINDLTSSI